jgi:hypothetical protein
VKFLRRTAGYTLFDHKSNEEIFGRVESRTSRRETKRIKNKLSTTCNKNEKQEDGKSNVEL